MTKRLWFQDCYIRMWKTKIQKVEDDGKKVVLKESAFYPEGGGQPTDTGFLSHDGHKFHMKKAKQKGGDIWHFLDKSGLKEGILVNAELNWSRRYMHMRMHTTQHLLSAILLDHYDAATAGNQIHTEHSRIDFQPFKPATEDLQFITGKFNRLVDEDRKVKIYMVHRDQVQQLVKNPKRLRLFNQLPDFVKRIRIVDINGVDIDPCAGTHVKTTGEIGHIHILQSVNKGKEKSRLIFELTNPSQ